MTSVDRSRRHVKNECLHIFRPHQILKQRCETLCDVPREWRRRWGRWRRRRWRQRRHSMLFCRCKHSKTWVMKNAHFNMPFFFSFFILCRLNRHTHFILPDDGTLCGLCTKDIDSATHVCVLCMCGRVDRFFLNGLVHGVMWRDFCVPFRDTCEGDADTYQNPSLIDSLKSGKTYTRNRDGFSSFVPFFELKNSAKSIWLKSFHSKIF